MSLGKIEAKESEAAGREPRRPQLEQQKHQKDRDVPHLSSGEPDLYTKRNHQLLPQIMPVGPQALACYLYRALATR